MQFAYLLFCNGPMIELNQDKRFERNVLWVFTNSRKAGGALSIVRIQG